jgi:cytidylate kinase
VIVSFVPGSPQRGRGVSQVAEQRMREWTLGLELQQRREKESAAAHLGDEIRPYIAISRETGAGGGVLARRLFEILGWDVLHREILDDMANRYQLPRDMLDFVDERTSNWLLEVFGKWISQRVVTQSEYIVHLGQIVLMAARANNAIFVGRGANFLLPSDRGVSIYLVAPMEMRVQHVRQKLKCSDVEAREHIRNTDKGRRDFVSRHFNKDVLDGHHHDLVINRARISIDEIAGMVIDVCRHRFGDVS